jgi:hypothetical protein
LYPLIEIRIKIEHVLEKSPTVCPEKDWFGMNAGELASASVMPNSRVILHFSFHMDVDRFIVPPSGNVAMNMMGYSLLWNVLKSFRCDPSACLSQFALDF